MGTSTQVKRYWRRSVLLEFQAGNVMQYSSIRLTAWKSAQSSEQDSCFYLMQGTSSTGPQKPQAHYSLALLCRKVSAQSSKYTCGPSCQSVHLSTAEFSSSWLLDSNLSSYLSVNVSLCFILTWREQGEIYLYIYKNIFLINMQLFLKCTH